MNDRSGALHGRTAVVTGASAGIGRAIAGEFIQQGAKVVVNARRAERLDALVGEWNRGRKEPIAAGAPGDCADPAVIESLFETAVARFGAAPDLVVVNAGRGLSGSVITSDTGEWEEMIRTNLLGAARLLRAASKRMIGAEDAASARLATDWKSRPRDIVVIGSVVGRHISPYSSMYGSTKFAVHGLAEGARRELSPLGIRVSLVEPGFVVSEFQGVAGYQDEWFKGVLEKLGPVLEPEDVARTVRFICEQPAHVHLSDVLIRPVRQEYP